MKILYLRTPYGKEFFVNEKQQMYYEGIEPSNDWIFKGIVHVKRNDFIPFSELSPETIEKWSLLWKNGNPQFTVVDMDHGIIRQWGNTKYHGIVALYWKEI